MTREHMIHTRVNKEEKEEAGKILEELGTNLSSVINMLIKNIILYKGIPFDVTLPKTEQQLEDDMDDSVQESISETDNSLEDNTDVEEDYQMETAFREEADDSYIFDTSDLDQMRSLYGLSFEETDEDKPVDEKIGKPYIDLSGMLDD